MTGIFSPGTVANTDARSGYFDSANGVFLKVTNGVAGLTLRTSTSGAAVDTEVLKSAWNIDKFDGSGPSGVTLDLTKTQIFFIEAQWLGVGRVVCGFDVNGVLYPAHQFINSNVITVPYTQTFNLPVRMELRNTGTSAGATLQFGCASVQSEGGEEPRGFARSASSGITTTGVTTRRPIISVRPKATYNGVTNRAHIEELEYALRATTNDAYIEVVIGGTLTGAVWTSASANSCTEFDVTATAIAGGEMSATGYATTGAGAVFVLSGSTSRLRIPLVLSQIDALAATQLPISIVATSFAGTSNIASALNWHEQVI